MQSARAKSNQRRADVSGKRRRPTRISTNTEPQPLNVRLFLSWRRGLREALRLLPVAIAAGLMIVEGLESTTARVFAGLSVAISVGLRLRQKESSYLRTVGLALAAIVAACGIVVVGGGFSGPAYPLILVTLAAVAAQTSRGPTITAAFAAIIMEFALSSAQSIFETTTFLWHLVFAIAFPALSFFITRVEVLRVRHQSEVERKHEAQRVRDETRLFRLVTVPSSANGHDTDRLFRSSVDEVHQTLFHTLRLLHKTLNLHSCVLLLGDSSELRLAEVVSNAEDVLTGPFPAGEGALGAVSKRQASLNLTGLKPGYKGVPFYSESIITSLLAIPLKEKDEFVGMLYLDRSGEQVFSEVDEDIAQEAGAHLLRTIGNERVFVQLERSKREQSVLFEASKSLGAALSKDAVLDSAFRAIRNIVDVDFVALTRFDEEKNRHSLVRVEGARSEAFDGLSFRDNSSLVSMAVRNKHYLPYRGDYDARQQTIFTRRANLRGMDSALVLPLVVREKAIGTFVLAAKEENRFPADSRAALQMLAMQSAVAISNADAVQRLEEMATTDGLTGCLNKRAFLEELDSKLKAAERFGRKLSLIVTDIDHFKTVNDTYGHATGDVVIRELGQLLIELKRDTDIVARFGGEEFCVLCEQTDTEGATHLAERVREALEAKVFQSEHGKVQVTASLGVATFPDHAKDGGALFEITDQALYAAKHGGRNQVRTA